MNKTNLVFKGALILISALLISALSIGFLEKEKVTASQRFSSENIPMCAPIANFKTDFGDMRTPLAPRLEYNWDHNFPITTTVPAAQRFFNQGLFYAYAFNHAEAERSFKEAIRLDPTCAMAYWGASLVLGPNINRPMPEEAFAEAYRFTQRALELRQSCTPKEQALIEALAKRYQENPPKDRSALDMAYANAMRSVANRYRDDVDILTLFAEALMDTMPWDYWEKDGTPKDATKEMLAMLDYVLEKDPEHPGANHYYIHAVEAVNPKLGERSADALGKNGFGAGHLVHMPSHIYIRVGRYEDSNVVNQSAAEIDEAYITQCQAQGFYPASYYPHNLHFIWFGASMEGSSGKAIDAARKTAEKGSDQGFKAIPLFALLRFGKWSDILKEPQPDTAHAYVRMLWHFARGMAFAKTGKTQSAKQELEWIEKSKDSPEIKALDNPFMPTIGENKMTCFILAAELAGLNKDFSKKVAHLREAIAIQDEFIYMEPPYFYYQVRQSLGAALLEAGKPLEAEAVYRADLEKFPNNGWSLYGLYQSLKAQGKTVEAKTTYESFEKAWVRADIKLTGSVL